MGIQMSSDNSSVGSFASSFKYYKQRFITNLFTKMYAITGEKGLHNILMALYRAKPECFVFQGDLHNSVDGKDTYFSGKIYTSNTHYYNIHIYGIMRGWTFNVIRTDIYMMNDDKQKAYTAGFIKDYVVDTSGAVNIW